MFFALVAAPRFVHSCVSSSVKHFQALLDLPSGEREREREIGLVLVREVKTNSSSGDIEKESLLQDVQPQSRASSVAASFTHTRTHT